MSTLQERRIGFFSPLMNTMKIMRLDDNNWRVEEEVVLPWIEKYTTGRFYLSEFSIGFESENDLLMFNLAFKK